MKFFLILLFYRLLFGMSVSGQQVIPLFTDSIPNSIGTIPKDNAPSITCYLPVKEKAKGTALIIFPGGAYSFLATQTEGIPIAEVLVANGIAAFVVKYRLPKKETMWDKSMGPLLDAQQAIKLVRMRAKEWDLDSNKIGVVGYSAGGHLASTLGTHFTTNYIANKELTNLRPDFMILVYPVISMDNVMTHRGSRINLLGQTPSLEKILFFCSEKQVTVKTPPTYITHAGDDSIVNVENSIAFYQACLRNKVKAELHLYPNGNHGFTQRIPVSEWLDPMLLWMKKGGFLNY